MISKFDPANGPNELVAGLLHQGAKGILGGESKSNKTWSLIDLALSVATGTAWWGTETNQGRVIYLNFEMDDFHFTKRMVAVNGAKGIRLKKNQFGYLNFRGKGREWTPLMRKLEDKFKGQEVTLIIIDPIYKGIAGRDENKAGEMAELHNEIEALCVATGAAVVYGHHFAKGNQAVKNPIDRLIGSGMFARDPDTILTITRLQEPDCFRIDSILRNFAQAEPVGLRWAFPLMNRDDEVNVDDLQEPGKAGGRSSQWSDEEFLETLTDGMGTGDWTVVAEQTLGMSGASFIRYLRAARVAGLVEKKGRGWART